MLLTYTERAKICPSPLAKQLFELMDSKQTNLALSADVTSAVELTALADKLGSEICVLKTHIDILQDFTPDLSQELKYLANKHQFLLFEDRKFADIGHTVAMQYQQGIYKIADWAHIVNAHSLPGEGIVKALSTIGLPKQRGLLLLAEMSSAGHLMDKTYQANTLKMAQAFPEFVIGFITQHALSQEPQWINMSPGIQIANKGDALGQQYVSPEQAILENGSDVIIVGRGILSQADQLAAAKLYRDLGWQAYQQRITR